MSTHIPVLLEEALLALEIKSDGRYLDATFGRGGHSRAILDALGADGRLFAIDRDPEAAQAAQALDDVRFSFVKTPFGAMQSALAGQVEAGTLDGILLDLGVSSPQLDTPERGFSFSKAGPLDMRMDPSAGLSAKEWLDTHDEEALFRIIRDYGDEPHALAKRLARAIFSARDHMNNTLDLAEIVREAMPKALYKPHVHPATQVFQALRIAVNDEFGEIERGLNQAVALLKQGGVLAVITFHGGEDALVKRFFRRMEGQAVPAEIPAAQGRVGQVLRLCSPVVKPTAQAVADNPRCRSARLRKAIKI